MLSKRLITRAHITTFILMHKSIPETSVYKERFTFIFSTFDNVMMRKVTNPLTDLYCQFLFKWYHDRRVNQLSSHSCLLHYKLVLKCYSCFCLSYIFIYFSFFVKDFLKCCVSLRCTDKNYYYDCYFCTRKKIVLDIFPFSLLTFD